MKIMLINPPALGSRPDDITAPPLGLAYLAAVLLEAGHEVELIDAFALGMGFNKLERKLEESRPDLVGVGGMTPIIDSAFQTLSLARKYTDYLVLGGAHASAIGSDVFEEAPDLDALLIGEAEHSFAKLVECLESKGKDADLNIPGVLIPGRDATERPLIEDLDALPIPARQLLPNKRYRHPILSGGPVATMITARGCPFQCIFCDKSVSGNRFRARSADSVLDEMQNIVLQTGISRIIIYDDLFTLDKQRVVEICQGILERDLKIRWKCEGRVGRVDPQTLVMMKRAGCEVIAYGVESGNPRALEYLRKGVTLDQIQDTFAITRAAGIKTLGYFILGIPVESFEDELETIKFARKLKADYAQFGVLSPFAGTELYQEAQAKGWYREGRARGPAEQGTRRPMLITEEWTEDRIDRILSRAHRDFYYRPAYILRRLRSLASMDEFRANVLAALKLAWWIVTKNNKDGNSNG